MHAGRDERFPDFSLQGRRRGRGARKLLTIAALMMASSGGCTEERHKSAIALVPSAPPSPSPQGPALPKSAVTVMSRPVVQSRPEAAENQVPTLEPAALLGLRPAAAIRLLGTPVNTQQQAMATKWVYRAGACSLAIFFYPDISNGTLRALKYEFADARTATTTGVSCDRRIALARNE